MSVPKITNKEFVDSGLLQELNRLFFHPMGMALAVEYPDGAEVPTTELKCSLLHAVGDPEGYIFAEGQLDQKKYERVLKMGRDLQRSRYEKLGYTIQPIPGGPARKVIVDDLAAVETIDAEIDEKKS